MQKVSASSNTSASTGTAAVSVEADIRQKAAHVAPPKQEHLWEETLPKLCNFANKWKHDTKLLKWSTYTGDESGIGQTPEHGSSVWTYWRICGSTRRVAPVTCSVRATLLSEKGLTYKKALELSQGLEHSRAAEYEAGTCTRAQ